MSSDSCPLWKMKGFCYMYTLQVGIAIISACGITLTTIALVVNLAHIVKWGSNQSLGQCAVQFVLFAVFLALGYTAYIYALSGAYREEVEPMQIALCALLAQALIWLVLTILSFLHIDNILDWTCVQGIRCADRFFIHHAYYRKSVGPSADEYNWRTDEYPHKVFSNQQDCLDYCNVYEITTRRRRTRKTRRTRRTRRRRTKTTTTTEKTSNATRTTISKATTKSKTYKTTKIKRRRQLYRNVFIGTLRGAQSQAFKVILSPRRKRAVNETTPSQGSTLPVNTSTVSDMLLDTPTNATSNISTPVTDHTSPNTTEDGGPSQRKKICECSPVKREFNTLIGKDYSTTHFVVSIVLIVFIAIFWYFYAVCILGSYITFLRTPVPRKSALSRPSALSTVPK